MACAAALWLREAPRYRARVVRQVWPPQGEHCQSCSSAVQPRRFCGLKRFGALRAITQTREKAKCCRVADARSTNAYKGGLSSWHPRGSASSQARRRVEAELEKYPQDCSRSSKRPLAVGHLQIARGLKPARRLYAIVRAQRVHGRQGLVRRRCLFHACERDAAFSRN